MARPASEHPTDAELEILEFLWAGGPAGLGAIREAVNRRRNVATTTVATTLAIMLQKGLVERGDGPRGYSWSAKVERRATASGLLRRLLDRAFEGSAGRLVAHLVEDGELSEADRDAIRKALDARPPDGGANPKRGAKP